MQIQAVARQYAALLSGPKRRVDAEMIVVHGEEPVLHVIPATIDNEVARTAKGISDPTFHRE